DRAGRGPRGGRGGLPLRRRACALRALQPGDPGRVAARRAPARHLGLGPRRHLPADVPGAAGAAGADSAPPCRRRHLRWGGAGAGRRRARLC
ncbi:MAG: hypothetical protein AVDCRST_MAG59-4249, partial [uncultured Thermomicrobiales bacterium]